MAQLPPKIPISMSQNWPNSFPHQRMASFIPPPPDDEIAPPPPPPPPQQPQQPCWVDEFLDFAAARRGAHRRSASDSIAFLELPLVMMDEEDECRVRNNDNNTSMHGFDRLDDEHLIMSMFSNDMSFSATAAAVQVEAVQPPMLSSSNPSTPSDQNSNNDEIKPTMGLQQQQPKAEPGEVESPCEGDPHAPPPPSAEAVEGDAIIDPKRVKRILANRQSAQRSRVRKLQYISELERSVTTLQSEVSALSPRVAFLDHQRLILNVDNSALKQRIAALAQDKIFKDAHQEALKKEIERLRQVYHQQNLKRIGNQSTQPPSAATMPQPPQQNSDAVARCTEKEQIPN